MQTLLTALVVVYGQLVTACGLGQSRGKTATESRAVAERTSLVEEAFEKHGGAEKCSRFSKEF